METVIVTAKNLIENLVRERLGEIPVARNAVAEKNIRSQRYGKLVSILTADGKFDERSYKKTKYSENQKLYEQTTRGSRKIPVEIRCFAKNEAETDEMLEEILRYLPRTWSIGRRNGTIDIMTEQNTDWSTNFTDSSMQSVFVLFTMEIAQNPVELPVIQQTQVIPA
jgi:hypothetical protein